MAGHRLFDRGPCRRAWQGKSGIECVSLEIISVRTRRRARPAILGAAEIGRPLDSIMRHAVFPNLCCFRIDVPKEPMGPGPARCIRIVHDQSETLDCFGKILDAQGRAHIGIVARIFFGDFSAVGKCAASHFEGSRNGQVLSLSGADHRRCERNQQEQSKHRLHDCIVASESCLFNKQRALARHGLCFVVGAIDRVAKRTKQSIIISK